MGKYPSDWDQRRKTVYQRDGYLCQRCGVGGGPNGNHELHAHHIVPISEGGSHNLDNLLTLCRPCHNAIHGDVFAPRWGVRETIDGTMPNPQHLPPEVQSYFEYAHTYNEVAEKYEEVIELLNELDEMLEAAVSLEEQGQSLPDNFHETYVPEQQKLLARVDTLEYKTNELLEHQKTGFSSDLREVCQRFEEGLSKSVDKCLEYSEQRRYVVAGSFRYAKVKQTSDSEEYEGMMDLREEHEKLLEESQQTVLEVQEKMISEINKQLDDYPGVSVRTGSEEEITEKRESNPAIEQSNSRNAEVSLEEVYDSGYTAKGYTGQVDLYKDRIEIRRKGLMATLNHWGDGDLEIPIEDIANIELKDPGWWKNGYIQFELKNDNSEEMSVYEATSDECSVVILKWQKDDFIQLKNLIDKLKEKEVTSESRDNITQNRNWNKKDRVTKLQEEKVGYSGGWRVLPPSTNSDIPSKEGVEEK